MKKSILFMLSILCICIWYKHSMGEIISDKRLSEDRSYNQPQVFEVKVDQKFTITLAANHTTGYRWELAFVPDNKVVELVSSDYMVTNDDGKVGSGGWEMWTFLAKGLGKAKISFKYVRPWEKEIGPLQTTSFEIIVGP